jgi:hypothetical protein
LVIVAFLFPRALPSLFYTSRGSFRASGPNVSQQ